MSNLVVGSTFGIYPPRGGGQLRVFHLYRQLAPHVPVDVVALVGDDQNAARRRLSPGLTEVRVPKSSAHAATEGQLQTRAGVALTDIAFTQLHRLTPAFSQAVADCIRRRSILITSHPYAFPAMQHAATELEWWYDAHNVEVDLKARILPRSRLGRRLLAQARAVERQCCQMARLVLVTCEEDGRRLRALYGVSPTQLRVIPNGVDAAGIRFTPPTERRELRARLRIARPLALFIGSWHQPNLLAARHILELARQLPEVSFVIVGSVGIPLSREQLPRNVELLGIVSDELKDALLGVAAVALNPMLDGSGTNMKMLDYLAAGIPAISTRVGVRGLDLDHERDLRVVPLSEFGDALRETLDEPDSGADARARTARREVEQRFDWRVVAAPLLRELGASEMDANQRPRARSAIRA